MICKGRSEHILVSSTPSYFAAQLFMSGSTMNIKNLSLTVIKCLVAILTNTENLLYSQKLDSFEYVLGWNDIFFKAEALTYPEASLSQCEAKVVSEAQEEKNLKLLSQNIELLDQEQKKIMLLDGFKLVQQKRRLC